MHEIPKPDNVQVVIGDWPTEKVRRSSFAGGHRKYQSILNSLDLLLIHYLAGKPAYLKIAIRDTGTSREIRAYSAAVRSYFIENFQRDDERLADVVIRSKRFTDRTAIVSRLLVREEIKND